MEPLTEKQVQQNPAVAPEQCLLYQGMAVGEVRVAEKRDFEYLRSLIDNNDYWKLEFKKSSTSVWTRDMCNTTFKMIKIQALFADVRPSTVYDVILDGEYRSKWDTSMLESADFGYLDGNNDIGYYLMKCPAPLKNRDFVLQRSWQQLDSCYCVFNHSVFHESLPQKTGIIRAVSHVTGYTVTAIPGGGCRIGYVTQTDLKGSLPAWMINNITSALAPKMVKRVYKACLKYEEWKAKHSPLNKVWLYPEQIKIPKIDINKCKKPVGNESSEPSEDITLLPESSADVIKEFISDGED